MREEGDRVDIIVCVKTNPDLQMVRAKNREAVLDGVPFKIGDLEKNALEAAVALRTAAGGKITALCLAEGNRKAAEDVKVALAMGADEAVVIDDPALAAPDQAAVAAALAAAVKRSAPVICCSSARARATTTPGRSARAWRSCSVCRRSATPARSRPPTEPSAASAAWTT